MSEKYVIDTDILIYYLKNNHKVVENFALKNSKNITTTIINYTELLFGSYNSSNKQRTKNLQNIRSFLANIEIIGFDIKAANKFAELKAKLKQEDNIIADMDLIIASICVAHNLILVTNNTKHFSRIEDLMFENWSL
ncbi:MAG: PIN domain-containing protein [Thiomargarita sp.]|nr:PIN domain-containing protein [Thiomargarita sp.]